MSNITKVQSLTAWEIPNLFSKNITDFKKMIDAAHSAFGVVGHLFNCAPYFKAINGTFQTTSDYIAATKTFGIIGSWIPDQDGNIPACQTNGEPIVAGFTTAFFQASDTIETIKFIDRLEIIQLRSVSENLGKILSKVQSGFVIAASALGIVNSSIAIKKTVDSFREHQLVFDPIGPFYGKSLIHSRVDGPIDADMQKHIDDTKKNLRNAAFGIVGSALLISLISLSIIGTVPFLAIGCVALAYGICEITSVVLKGHDSKQKPLDPQITKAWHLVDTLHVPTKA